MRGYSPSGRTPRTSIAPYNVKSTLRRISRGRDRRCCLMRELSKKEGVEALLRGERGKRSDFEPLRTGPGGRERVRSPRRPRGGLGPEPHEANAALRRALRRRGAGRRQDLTTPRSAFLVFFFFVFASRGARSLARSSKPGARVSSIPRGRGSGELVELRVSGFARPKRARGDTRAVTCAG